MGDIYNKILNKRGLKKEDLTSYKEVRLSNWEDMEEAVKKSLYLLSKSNNDVVIGVVYDVDVDGLFAGYIAEDYFKRLGYKVLNYMNYFKQHGVTEGVIDWAKNSGITHLFVVDAGSGDGENLNIIADHGVDIWVLDHHPYEDNIKLNKKICRVNPIDYDYLPKLSGCGVVYRFVERLSDFTKIRVGMYEKYVGITVLSDICSMVDKENRYYVEKAYNEYQSELFLKKFPFYGSYKSFYSYKVIPYLNALIRIGKNKKAIKTVNNMDKPAIMNKVMQDVEITKAEQKRLQEDLHNVEKLINRPSVVISLRTKGEDILGNVNGLYANQLINKYEKSSMVLKYFKDIGLWRGSFRGWNFSNNELGKWNFKTMGHANACGLEVTHDDLKYFIKNFSTESRKKQEYDGVYSLYELDSDTLIKIAEFNEFSGADMPTIYIKLVETLDDVDKIDIANRKSTLYFENGITITDFGGKGLEDREIILEPVKDELSKIGYQLIRK